MKYKRATLLMTAMALTGLALGTGVAGGSMQHPAVVSEDAATHTPHLESDTAIPKPLALAVAELNGTMYVGGKFHSVQNAGRTTSYTRNNIVAFDADSPTIHSFAPDLNGTVFSLLGVGDSIYVGGQFTTVDGTARAAIAKLDAQTGELDTAFKPKINTGRVSEIRLVNDRLLVSGTFSRRLLAIDPDTGANTGYINLAIAGVLPLAPNKTEVYRFAVNPAGTRLVGVGNFTSVDGQNRRRAFMLTLGDTSASLNSWYYPPLDKKCISNTPTRQAYLDDVDFSPDGSYFVFAATGFVPTTTAEIGTMVCDAAARFETNIAAPVKPTWINYTGGDTLHSVAITGAAVYVQGHNRWLDNPQGKDTKGPGAVDRPGIGAINPVTGMALPWDPRKPAAQGGQDFFVTDQGLWVVSDSTRFGGKYHKGIAFAPLP